MEKSSTHSENDFSVSGVAAASMCHPLSKKERSALISQTERKPLDNKTHVNGASRTMLDRESCYEPPQQLSAFLRKHPSIGANTGSASGLRGHDASSFNQSQNLIGFGNISGYNPRSDYGAACLQSHPLNVLIKEF